MKQTRFPAAALAVASLLLAAGASAQFGDGSDGTLVVNSPTDIGADLIAVTGSYSIGATSMTLATPSPLLAGEEVMIIDLQGANAGNYEFATLASVSPTSVTFTSGITKPYSDSTRLVKVLQYANLSVTSTGVLTSSSGIIAIRCQTPVTIEGEVSVYGAGHAGGSPFIPGMSGEQGDSPTGAGIVSPAANGGGGGGAQTRVNNPPGGGGGGHASGGTAGQDPLDLGLVAAGGGTYGTADLSQLFFGSGGGGGAAALLGGPSQGGNGGGIIWMVAPGFTIETGGSIDARGDNGESGSGSVSAPYGGAGAGAGGSIYLGAGSGGVTVNGLIVAFGGIGGINGLTPVLTGRGGDGGSGRIRIDGTITGSTNVIPPVGFNGPELGPPPASADGAWSMYE